MKATTVKSREFAHYYHKMMSLKKRSKERMIRDRMEVLKIEGAIMDAIQDHFINNEGGVYIEGIGMFAHITRQGRRFRRFYVTDTVAFEKSGGYAYRNAVIDFTARKRPYQYFMLASRLSEAANDFVRKGFRYLFPYREVMEKRRVTKRMKIGFMLDNKPLYYKKQEL